MNERIKQLVKRAGGHFEIRNLASNPVQHKETIELWDDHIEKFAQLIVEETLQVARAGIEFGNGMEDAVYTYFGIEE